MAEAIPVEISERPSRNITLMPAPFEADDLAAVIDRSFTIPTEKLPGIRSREHMCRPYPGGDYDVLLINVPSTFQQGLIPDGEEAPHGLLRMIATARDYAAEVDPSYPTLNAGILDAHRLNLDPEDIIGQVLKTRSKVVGLNPTSVNVSEAQVIAEKLDEAGVPYILGGVHATLDVPIARYDFPNAAAIVRGTGELAIGPIVEAVLNGEEPALPGVYWRSSDHASGERTEDIDVGKLPVIRQDLLVEEPVYEHSVVIDGHRRQIKEANLFVTYGCPFNCTFCASPVMVGRNERNHRPA